MSNWVKNAIGLSFVAILLVVAWRFWQGDGGEVTIMDGGVVLNPKPGEPTIVATSPPVAPDTARTPLIAAPVKCRIPENGIERWAKVESWTANSGWRKGGSSPGEFCGTQKQAREAQYPDRKVVLLSTDEKNKSEYTPFKHDYYNYSCFFEDRWDPIYKLAANEKCPSS